MNRKAVFGWCFYDWANSAYPTLISTFVFATYFTQGIAETPEVGTTQWGYATSLAALIIAVLAPVLGAISDRVGRRKPWLLILTLIGAASSIGLWWATPEPSSVTLALVFVIIGTVCFELGMVFYNAMLPEITNESHVGRVSGWGWGLGYLGGLSALAISLVLFIQPDPSPFGLDRGAVEHVRIIPVLVGVWMVVFAIPLFLFVPSQPASPIGMGQAVRDGLATLWRTLRHLGQYREVLKFLVARMLYIDGLNTLFAFGGIFAAAAFGMDSEQVLLFGISLNVSSGIGAFAFSFLDDRWGPKPVIAVSVAGIALFGGAMLLTDDIRVFWLLGLGIGLFLGPAQSASRSMMARIAPAELRAEFFGLYAFSGKATAFVGPALLATAVDATGSQHWGMATIFPFLIAGLLLLAFVRNPRKGGPATV
ncbi:MAG: MFS transporter [Alphaproteobacteria bacterium]